MTGSYDIRGTWFPSGFHGHFRSKSRSEFNIPYRHRARPVPPEKFLNYAACVHMITSYKQNWADLYGRIVTSIAYTPGNPGQNSPIQTFCKFYKVDQGSLRTHKERSTRHLFSRHDNRHAHSDMGDLETYFGMGMGKRKQLQSGQTQHTKSTRDIITWRGNECPNPTTTYRSDYPTTSRNVTNLNESEPIHVRSNLGLRRRQFRAASAPPSQRRTAPLLAWNEPDESQHGKPGVGLRQPIRNQRPNFTSETPFAHTAPPAAKSQSTQNEDFTVSETIVPLNAT